MEFNIPEIRPLSNLEIGLLTNAVRYPFDIEAFLAIWRLIRESRYGALQGQFRLPEIEQPRTLFRRFPPVFDVEEVFGLTLNPHFFIICALSVYEQILLEGISDVYQQQWDYMFAMFSYVFTGFRALVTRQLPFLTRLFSLDGFVLISNENFFDSILWASDVLEETFPADLRVIGWVLQDNEHGQFARAQVDFREEVFPVASEEEYSDDDMSVDMYEQPVARNLGFDYANPELMHQIFNNVQALGPAYPSLGITSQAEGLITSYFEEERLQGLVQVHHFEYDSRSWGRTGPYRNQVAHQTDFLEGDGDSIGEVFGTFDAFQRQECKFEEEQIEDFLEWAEIWVKQEIFDEELAFKIAH